MDINALDNALSTAKMKRPMIGMIGGSAQAAAPAFPDVIGMMADQDRAPAEARRANEARSSSDTRADNRIDHQADHRQEMEDRSRDATAADRRQDRAQQADADQTAPGSADRETLVADSSGSAKSNAGTPADAPVVPDAAPLPVSLEEARKAARNAAEALGSGMVPASGQAPAEVPGQATSPAASGNGQAVARQDLPGGQTAQGAQTPTTPAAAQMAAAQTTAAEKAAAQQAATQNAAAQNAASTAAQAGKSGPANSAAALTANAQTAGAQTANVMTAKAPDPIPAQLPSQAALQAQQALEGAQPRVADTGSPNSPASQNAASQNAANQSANAQNAGGQNSGGQNQGGQQQGASAQPTFQFGQASFGGNTPEAAASRAQFQQIMATRTARPAPLGATSTSSNALGSNTFGAGQSGLTSSPIAAGPGGPQSTFSASLASQVAQATPGRSSATPGTAVDQVAVKLSSSAKDGSGKISIKLNPEELGRVDVKLDIGRDGMVRATVMADRPETLDLLQRDARGLERALQEAGLKTDGQSLNFEGQEQREAKERGQPDRPGGSNGNPDDGAADDLAEANITDTESGPSDDGSLNLVA